MIEQLVKLYKESYLGKRLPVYDGRKSLYTAGPLPFQSKEFKITLVDDDEGSGAAKYVRIFILFYFIFLSFLSLSKPFVRDADEIGSSRLLSSLLPVLISII